MEDEDLTIADLVGAAGAGDDAAWNRIVQRFTPLVSSVTARHHLSPEDAADVAQTLWLRLVQHLPALREPAALPGWITATAKHESRRVITARRRVTCWDPLREQTPRSAVPDERSAPDFTDRISRAERHEALLLALAELSERDLGLLLLMLTDPPLPYAEISRRLGIPIGGIGPNRARALERVRRTPAMAALLGAG